NRVFIPAIPKEIKLWSAGERARKVKLAAGEVQNFGGQYFKNFPMPSRELNDYFCQLVLKMGQCLETKVFLKIMMMRESKYHPIISAFSFPCLLLKPVSSGFRILDANEALLRVSGMKLEHILNKDVLEAFPVPEKRGNPKAFLAIDSLKKVV